MSQPVYKLRVKNESDTVIGAVARLPQDYGDYNMPIATGGEHEITGFSAGDGTDIWVTVAPFDGSDLTQRRYTDGPQVTFNSNGESVAVYTITGSADNLSVSVDFQS